MVSVTAEDIGRLKQEDPYRLQQTRDDRRANLGAVRQWSENLERVNPDDRQGEWYDRKRKAVQAVRTNYRRLESVNRTMKMRRRLVAGRVVRFLHSNEPWVQQLVQEEVEENELEARLFPELFGGDTTELSSREQRRRDVVVGGLVIDEKGFEWVLEEIHKMDADQTLRTTVSPGGVNE